MKNRSTSVSYESPSKMNAVISSDDDDDSEIEEYQHEPIVTIIEPDHISEKVIDAVLSTLPKNDTAGYTKTLKKIKWDEIKIDNRSPQEVQQIFEKAIKDVNKVRTLTEILNDAKQRVNRFDQHPDCPKRPLTLFSMFVQDRYKHIKEQNPNSENTEILKKCSEEFKLLSEKKRQKLVDRHAVLVEEYQDKLEKYQLKHPDLQKSTKRSAKEPKLTCPFAYYWAEKSKKLGKSSLQAYSDARKEYNELDMTQKSYYFRKYFEEADADAALSKPERKAFLEAKGAPTHPSGAFNTFVADNQDKLAHLPPKERMTEASTLWAKLDKEKKERYVREANVEQELYKQKWKKFLKTLTKEERRWIEVPKPVTKRKQEVEVNDESSVIEEPPQKIQKPSNALPEPQKPTDDVITFYANKKFEGDRKAAKKHWKSLKDKKKDKYQAQLEKLQAKYFEDLKTYLKSLTSEEVKAYKKRMRKEIKDDVESS